MSREYDYWQGDMHVYVEVADNGDELVSEYGKGYQRAYIRPKAQLDYWKENAKTPSTKSLDREGK